MFSLFNTPLKPARLVISSLALACLAHADSNIPVIAHKLQPLVDHRALAGAVTVVANKDRILSLEAVGYADMAAQKAMSLDSLFWIASMSKPITGAAFMLLVDEGKVNVEDPVEKYLPEFKGQMVVSERDENHVVLKKPIHPILVRNVLSHTSGLSFASPIEQPTLDQFPLATRVKSYAMMNLKHEPDSKYEYSNAGINTAGRIIEVLSGMGYEEFLQKRLFGPLGMKDTTSVPNSAQIARLAKAYKANQAQTDLEETTIGQLKYPLDDPSRQPMPAGGFFSTAKDVTIFCQMLLNGGMHQGKRILSEAAVKQMTSRQTAPELAGYGLGFSVNGTTFGHGGAFSTDMSIDSAKGLITVFMVQNAGWREEGKQAHGILTKAAREMIERK
jgi:CubicO group peptidase (beta-lactamase class C family)